MDPTTRQTSHQDNASARANATIEPFKMGYWRWLLFAAMARLELGEDIICESQRQSDAPCRKSSVKITGALSGEPEQRLCLTLYEHHSECAPHKCGRCGQAGRKTSDVGSHATGAGCGLRRHRHQPFVCRAGDLQSRARHPLHAGEHPRRHLGDLLGVDDRRLAQVRHARASCRQPRRRRHHGVAGARGEIGGRSSTRGDALCARSACSALRCSTATPC